MSGQKLAYLSVSIAVAAWGASFIATKFALRDVSPVTVVWVRFTMGVLILGGTMFARRQFAWPPREEWGYLALLGFSGVTFHQWLQSNALLTAQATTTAWIVTTTPVFIPVLGWLVLRERLGLLRIFGIALASSGVLLVVSKGDVANLAFDHFGEPGDILVLISSVNWAVFSVLSRRGLREMPAARMMFFVMSLGGLFSTVLFLSQGSLWVPPGFEFTLTHFGEIAHLTLAGWLGIGFLGVFCSGLAYILWYDALQSIPASRVGVFLYIEPLIALVVAGLLLGEQVTWAALLGGAIILWGVWLVNRPQSIAQSAPNARTASSQRR